MKYGIVLVCAAGFASAAVAQQSVTLSIVPSSATIDSTTTTSFTLSLFGDADFGTAIGGGGVGLSAVGGAGIVTDMTGVTAEWGALGFQDFGHASEGNYDGLVFGQLIFPPFIDPNDGSFLPGPVLLGVITVSIEANSAGEIDWTTTASIGSDIIIEIFTDDDGDGFFTSFTEVDHGSTHVTIIPAPSALVLLGLGGLVAGRRRR